MGLVGRSASQIAAVIAALQFVGIALAAEPDEAARRARIESFEKQVRPLLARHCYECHSTETGPDNGELVLDTAAGLRAGGSRGPMLQAGRPDDSLLIRAVRYRDETLQMPPAGKLKDSELGILEEWISAGAELPDDVATPQQSRKGIDIAAGRNFWSFRPLADPPAPDVLRDEWVRRPVDAYILHQLEQRGLAPSPEADRRTLIRRVTFDLIGLPPTPEEIAAFVADDRPDAYERLIERLLASPHYGERWGRFWLDLARYTDKTASWLNSTDQAWLYRDWVVAAFNADRPYDEVVRLQLAADLSPDTPPEDFAALGLLGLSPSYWKELKLAPAVIEEIVAEEWDERIDAVTQTFLGLTVACARCHDHKFDPITVQDYYALAGVFASSRLDERPLLSEPEASVVRTAREKIRGLEAQLGKIKDKASPEARALEEQIQALRTSTPHIDAPWANVVSEASLYVLPDGKDRTRLDYRPGQPRDLPVFKRGNPSNPGEIIPRRFLAVLSPETPEPFREGSGRRELADAILNEAQALTARVYVNRIWGQHFGMGLVRTPSNFGAQGERPTHPELLDSLATAFVRHGMSTKWLHREIMLSATYRQSSRHDSKSHELDPENRWLWRMNRRRLSIEMWRDAMLAAAGNLDPTFGGAARSLDHLANTRRTLYGLVDRYELNQMLRLFDFPESTAHSARREPTTTPLQQLFVLNGPFLAQQSSVLAASLPHDGDETDRIAAAYQRLFGRTPTPREVEIGVTFLSAGTADGEPVPADRWTSYLHSLLALNEFLFVD